MEDVEADMMGDLVDDEMQQTAKAVEEAAAKIAVCVCVEFNNICWRILWETLWNHELSSSIKPYWIQLNSCCNGVLCKTYTSYHTASPTV